MRTCPGFSSEDDTNLRLSVRATWRSGGGEAADGVSKQCAVGPIPSAGCLSQVALAGL